MKTSPAPTPDVRLRSDAPTSERNPTVEAWIKSFGVYDWGFHVVQLDDVDRAQSLANQSRLTSLDESTVARYGLAAASGAKFPPIVLAKIGRKLVVVDGNHRVHGLAAGGAHEHPAYVIDPPAAVRDMMTRTANTANGLNFSEDEQRRLVIDLHTADAMTREQISLLSGLSRSSVDVIVRAHGARQRATDRRAADRLTDREMETIGRLNSDPALNAAIGVQRSRNRLPDGALVAAVVASNKARSDEERVKCVTDAAVAASGAKAATVRKGVRTSDYAKLNQSIGSILNCNPTAVALDVKDKRQALERINAAVAHLAKIEAAL